MLDLFTLGIRTLRLVDGVSRIFLNPAVAEFVQMKVRYFLFVFIPDCFLPEILCGSCVVPWSIFLSYCDRCLFRLSCDGGNIKDFSWGKNYMGGYSSGADVVRKYPRKTLFQLSTCVETGVFLVVGKIVQVLESEAWWFPVCKCGRVMHLFDGSYYCYQCCLRIFDVVPKYVLLSFMCCSVVWLNFFIVLFIFFVVYLG